MASPEVPAEPTANRVTQFMRSWGNPAYHWRKFREDLVAAKHGLKVWHLGALKRDPDSFNRAARGKLFSAFVLAGAFACIALPAGAAVQAATNSAWLGMVTPIIVGHGVSNIAFQIIWWATNHDLYRGDHEHNAFVQMESDLLPLQWEGLKVVAPLILLALPFNALLAFLLERFFPNAVRYLPIAPVMATVEVLFFNGTYVRLMGNLYERYSRRMTLTHCGREPESEPAPARA